MDVLSTECGSVEGSGTPGSSPGVSGLSWSPGVSVSAGCSGTGSGFLQEKTTAAKTAIRRKDFFISFNIC